RGHGVADDARPAGHPGGARAGAVRGARGAAALGRAARALPRARRRPASRRERDPACGPRRRRRRRRPERRARPRGRPRGARRDRRRRALPHRPRRRLRDRRRRRVLRPGLPHPPPHRALVERRLPRDDPGPVPRRRRGGALRHRLRVLLGGVRADVPLPRRRGGPRRHAARRRLPRRPGRLPLPAGRPHRRGRLPGALRRRARRAQGGDPSGRGGCRLVVNLAGKRPPGGALPNSEIEQLSIDTIRTLSMDAVQKANAGHPGTAMALAPLAYLLYAEVLNHNPASPHWPNRDRLILSAGHACVLQYSALHLAGYNLSLEELKRFRQWQSATPGHPEFRHTPGVEVTTGPLGQGFANGVGMAFAERFLAATFNRPQHDVVDHRVYVICSDGDLMEGVSYEAASLAGTNALGKLVYFYDDNHITIDGTTSISFTEDRAARFEALGWHVQSVADANDLASLRDAIENAQNETARPSLVVVRSHIAFGAPRAVDTAKAHGSPLGEEEVAATKRALGWDPDRHFYVPDEVYAHMNRVDRGNELESEWQQRFSAWSEAFPDARERWDAAWDGRIGPWTPPEFEPGEQIATRDAGKQVMQAFKDAVPTMIGGAADLVESTKTEFGGGGLFSDRWAGRNIAFGIREHAMGSIVNGIGVHGGCVKPFGSTFLIFSDYMRPAVRLSALMELPVVWVWTHDSVGLGEDGPTHQPVETYAALRAIPHLWFIRPADAN